MRLSGFSVEVTSQSGDPFHEVIDIRTNEVYIVAEAGNIFQIRSSLLPERIKNRGKVYGFIPRVDGKSAGIMQSKFDDNAGHSSVLGFVREKSQQGTTYDLFKFAAASQDDSAMAQSLEFKEGRITVSVHLLELENKNQNLASKGSTMPASASKVPALPEGKKFFLAPSLTTTSGGVYKGPAFNNRKFRVVKEEAVFQFRYETPSTLLLRGILRRDNPVHAAILDSYPETRQQHQPRNENPSTTTSNFGSVKTEPRVKRERNTHTTAASAAFGDNIINLVGSPPAPRELGKDLICDLTGDDGAPPRWKKRQRE